MPTVARSTLRPMVSRNAGFFYSSSATSDGNAGGTTVVDTTIARFDTNLLTNKWLYLTSGAASGEAQRIASVSSSTITLAVAVSVKVLSGVTYEIMSYDPLEVHQSLLTAIRQLYPTLYLPIFDETIVVDNLVANFDFETGTFTSWSSVGSPTLTANTSYFVHGSQSANIAGAAGVGMSQNLITAARGFQGINEASKKTLHVRGWLRATDASNIRLRLTFNGSTYTNGSYHQGRDDWEGPNRHRLDVTIPADATEMTMSIEKSTGVAAQADMVVAWIDPITRYTQPTSIVDVVDRILQQDNELAPNGEYTLLNQGNTPIPGRLLRLEGKGYLSEPSTDAGTVEISQPRAELLTAYATHLLFDRLQHTDAGNAVSHEKKGADWLKRAEAMAARPGVRMHRNGVSERIGWHSLDSSGTRYIYLVR